MKVLLVTPYFYPKVGGLETYSFQIAQKLVSVGNEVTVVTSNHTSKEDELIKIRGLKVYRLKILITVSNTPINPLWILKINEILKKEKPDLVFAHSPVPFIADVAAFSAWINRIPFVLMYHAGSLRKGSLIADSVAALYAISFEKMLFHLSKKILVLNEFVKVKTLKNLSKVIVIQPGITITSEKLKKENKNYRRILFVGNLSKTHSWKGLDYLLEAFSLLQKTNSDLELQVVGGGNNLDHFKEFSKELDVWGKTNFVGEVRQEDTASFYEKGGVLVLPSTSDAESLGLVILEAMSFGLPVVASNVGGIPHIIEDKVNGFLVEPRNPKKLSIAIQKIIEKDTYSVFSKNNLADSKKYSWTSHLSKLQEIFEKVIKE